MLDMTTVSVVLPRKSTVILPRVGSVASGYITGMEPTEILAWVDERKVALGIKSDAKVGKMCGHPDVVRNMRRGLSSPKLPALRALAKALGEPPADLFHVPDGKTALPTLDEMEAERLEHLRQAEALRITIDVLRARKRAG